ncbi:hypothetical protein BDZ97DRAFT_1877863 [Flammula alnicola]|nr:hypothetical protein BDZ97DRAFT_1877863 [Flammula alnicola]
MLTVFFAAIVVTGCPSSISCHSVSLANSGSKPQHGKAAAAQLLLLTTTEMATDVPQRNAMRLTSTPLPTTLSSHHETPPPLFLPYVATSIHCIRFS